MSLTLDEAIAYIDAGIAKAKEIEVRVSLAVVDEFGRLVQVDRMDGAPLMSPDVAEAKALTALNFQLPTSEVSQLDPETLKMIGKTVVFPVLAIAGGAPIFDGNNIKGAIGVSGATLQQEDAVAKHAAARP
jgi:uncharacterized protein GlcG (DUF336 family)